MPGSATAEVIFIAAMMILILLLSFSAVFFFFKTYKKEMAQKEARKAETPATAKMSTVEMGETRPVGSVPTDKMEVGNGESKI